MVGAAQTVVLYGKTNMIKTIGANPGSSGLGDILSLTIVCKHFPGLTVQLHPAYERFAFLFRGLCDKVELTQSPVHTKGIFIEDATFGQSMLHAFGYTGEDTTPFIFVDTEKYEQAKLKIKDIKKPLIFKPNCSKRWSHIREYSSKYVQEELNKYITQGYTPIQVGINENFTPYEGCMHWPDISLEELAALYKAVGFYFGTDTGDYHLMIAVGGKAVALIPGKNYPDYNPKQSIPHFCSRAIMQIVPKEYCK